MLKAQAPCRLQGVFFGVDEMDVVDNADTVDDGITTGKGCLPAKKNLAR
jgi:hypothetical protein